MWLTPYSGGTASPPNVASTLYHTLLSYYSGLSISSPLSFLLMLAIGRMLPIACLLLQKLIACSLFFSDLFRHVGHRVPLIHLIIPTAAIQHLASLTSTF